MLYLVAYAGVLVVYLVLDQLWLRAVMRPRLARVLGEAVLERPRSAVAIVLGVVYAAVLTLLAALPGLRAAAGPLYVDGQPVSVEGWLLVIVLAAVVGLFICGIRTLGNAALLRGWGWGTALLDTGWGMAASVLAALAGYLVGSAWAG